MDLLLPWLRVVIGGALSAFVIYRLAMHWRRASAYSEGMAAEQGALRAVHAQLSCHPTWQKLWYGLASRGVRVSPHGPQPGAFHFGLLTLTNDLGQRAMRIDDPSARYLVAYLRGPKDIVASLVLANGEVHVRDVGFGEWPPEAY